MKMSKLSIGACLALVCLSPTAMAQDIKPAKSETVAAASANRETLDSSVARLAVKAALQPSVQPTQQELFSLIVLMSLREQQARGT